MRKPRGPKIRCPRHSLLPGADTPLALRSKGTFKRASDGAVIKRFACLECGRTFSESTLTLEYRQRKRSINQFLFVLLSSNNSMRRAAIITRVARRTVERRLPYLAKVAERHQQQTLQSLPPVQELHFDDMESSEHTKLKPVSIPLTVAHPSRIVIAYDVASMPAKGLLAKKSLKKYGKRKDERLKAWREVLATTSQVVAKGVIITSDSHKSYPAVIKEAMQEAQHRQVKSRRGCIAGQGELKVGGFDSMFSINHTAAMLRANICRLIRKTWCTTKKRERLRMHIAFYVMWHNETILASQENRERRFPFAA